MPPGKKSPKKKHRRHRKPPERQSRVLFAALFLCGFLALSLVFLSELRRFLDEPPLSSVKDSGISRDVVAEVREELENTLLRSGFSREQRNVLRKGDLLQYEMTGDFPRDEPLKKFRMRLREIDQNVRVAADPGKGEIRIHHEEKLLFFLRFHPAETIPSPYGPEPPKISIIMDDLGRDLDYLDQLLDLGLPVTVAILPGELNASRAAVLANSRGSEVLIHIPMEPRSYPVNNPGRDALFTEFSAEEIRSRFREYVTRVPHAVGGNNHMGSRFTEDVPGMNTVMGLLKEEGLFFVDSLTTGDSVGISEARKAGIPSAARDVFLDNEADVALISEEIRRLVRVAKKQGTAVGICHPYPQTLEALRRMKNYPREQGVEVVPVSRLIRP